MRGYARIYARLWMSGTGKKLRIAGRDAQVVAFYLMTGAQANMLGLYYLPKTWIAHETGLSLAETDAALKACEQAGFSSYDDATETVWVYEMARFQVAEKLAPTDKRVKGVQSEYEYQPENPYLTAFYDKYAVAFCMSKCRGRQEVENSLQEIASKPLPSQKQKQKQKQNQNQSQNLANTDVLAVASDAGDVSGRTSDSAHQVPLPPVIAKSASLPLGGGKPAAAQGGTAETGTAKPSPSDGAQSTAGAKDQPGAVSAATACPHQDIIALYHEVLPQCPRVRDWTHGRARQLRSRWNEDPERQNLGYWRKYFTYVAGCAFLTGKSQLPGKRPFIADLEWLTKAINFTKVRERQYENY